ncbi:WSC domain-containing protein, partial [Podospora fimiseda]
MWSRVSQALLALLLTVLSFLGAVDAQAYYGTVARERAFCGLDNFYYLGCFENFETTAGNTWFAFDATGYNPAHPGRNFPGWDPGSLYNNTVMPLDCNRVCRGFGYRFSSIRDNNCKCGMQLPSGYLPGDNALCNVPCGGDQSQTCGGGSAAQVYLDPSFAAINQVARPADPLTGNPTLGSSYRYLGCYYTQEGFPTQDSLSNRLLAGGTQSCLNYCAGLGYPMSYAYQTNGTAVNCFCGTSLGFNSFRARAEFLPTPGDCNATCSTTTPGGCDVGAERCCGRNNYAPIYINPELQGCYPPRIPGFKTQISDPTYECYDVPQSLLGPPKTLSTATVDPAMLATGTPALIRPPTVDASNGARYYLYACFGSPSFVDGGGGSVLNGVLNAATGVQYLDFQPATLENCANLCQNSNLPVFGVTNGR